MTDLQIEKHKNHDGVVRLEAIGSVDAATSDQLEAALNAAVAAGCRRITLDLSGLLFMASVGWGLLLSSNSELHRRGGALTLTGMRPEIRHVYEILGLKPILREASSDSPERYGFVPQK